MVTEDYVSFEVAKLLKEKEFDEICYLGYNKNGEYIPTSNRTNSQIIQPDFCFICCPTIQMVMKWLREDKGVAVVPILSSVLDNEKFLWDIEITVAKTNESYHQGWIYEHYESACEAAIKYCLENLI